LCDAPVLLLSDAVEALSVQCERHFSLLLSINHSHVNTRACYSAGVIGLYILTTVQRDFLYFMRAK